MRVGSFVLLAVTAAALAAAAASGAEQAGQQSPTKGDARYQVLERRPGYEVREYSAALWAVATVQGRYDLVAARAREELDRYWQGANSEHTSLAPTSPVVQAAARDPDGAMLEPGLAAAYLLPSEWQERPPQPEPREGGAAANVSLETVGPLVACAAPEVMALPLEKAVVLAAHALGTDLKRDGRVYNPGWVFIARYRGCSYHTPGCTELAFLCSRQEADGGSEAGAPPELPIQPLDTSCWLPGSGDSGASASC